MAGRPDIERLWFADGGSWVWGVRNARGRRRAIIEFASEDGPSEDATVAAGSPSATDIVLRASGLGKIFETGDGIADLDLTVERGSILGLIGPSGSGKTTAVRMMTGVLEPTSGSLEVLGQNPRDFDSATRVRLGYMPQLSVLYPDLTVEENLRFLGSLYGKDAKTPEAMAAVLDFVELEDHEDKRVSAISGGMQRRLSLAATLIHEPELMFLDEPTAGIDPILRRKFWDHFTDLKEAGKTLIVTTQYVGEAAYCDHVAVLAEGRLLMVETPDGLRRAAYGGDVVVIEFARRPSEQTIESIVAVSGATSWRPTGMNRIEIVVEEAAVSLPTTVAWLNENGVAIEQAEEVLPPFDDVFVDIVKKGQANAGAA